MVPALGPSLVKPTVAGTTARASSEAVRSIGYSIYYTLVNVGGMLGPIVAYLRAQLARHRERLSRLGHLRLRHVLGHAAVLSRAIRAPNETPATSVAAALRNMLAVLTQPSLCDVSS